jgi:hypothetical protein
MRPMNLRKAPLSIGEKAALVVTALGAAFLLGLAQWALDLDDRLGFWIANLLKAVLVGVAVATVVILFLRKK